jgi:flagellar biosynthesis component FlhA
MSSYVGHCDDCDTSFAAEDVLMEAKKLILAYKEQYGEEKTSQIVDAFKNEVSGMTNEWFLEDIKSINEIIDELVVEKIDIKDFPGLLEL